MVPGLCTRCMPILMLQPDECTSGTTMRMRRPQEHLHLSLHSSHTTPSKLGLR